MIIIKKGVDMLSDKEKLDYLVDYATTENRIYVMALTNDWSRKDLDNIYSIMDKYFELDDYIYSNIENDFREKLNMDYNDLKSLFIYFYDMGRYESVIAKYLKTNYDTFKNVSSEYNEMYDDLKARGLIK